MGLKFVRNHPILEWLEPIDMTKKSLFGMELKYLISMQNDSTPILVLKNGQVDSSCIAEIIKTCGKNNQLKICGNTKRINYLFNIFKLDYHLENIQICNNGDCLCPYRI